jgi:hypothetical protein
VYSYSFNATEEPVYLDAFQSPVTNSSGEAYDPPLSLTVFNPVVHVTKNVASFDSGLATYFVGGVNMTPWRGNARRTIRVNSISAQQKFEGDAAPYWELQCELEARLDTWDLNVLDQGYVELIPGTLPDGTSGNVQRWILDANGQKKTTPTMLNGEGRVLSITTFNNLTGAQETQGGSPVFRKVRLHREVAFALLGL